MLKSKTALITGSTSGIGLEIARAMADQGCRVLINGLGDQSQIDTIITDITRRSGQQALFAQADLSNPQEIESMMADLKRQNCLPDILVNNAGIQHVSRTEEFPPEQWDRVIAINLSSVFHTMRLALPYMQAQGWGRIINVASVHGQVASAGKSAYVAAKHGVVGLTKTCALENAGSGVTANAICPGWVRTELVEKQITARAEKEGVGQEEAARMLLAEKQPSLQFVMPQQLAQAALFICSDACTQMTGVNLTLDGGWTAQ